MVRQIIGYNSTSSYFGLECVSRYCAPFVITSIMTTTIEDVTNLLSILSKSQIDFMLTQNFYNFICSEYKMSNHSKVNLG